MKGLRASIYRYALPLAKPLTSDASVTTREGCLLMIDGKGTGEIAPLPGLYKETLDEAIAELESLFRGDISLENCSPSVQWGVDMALHGNLSTKHHVLLNALLQGSADDVLLNAKKYFLQGFRCFKLKVSGRSIGDNIELVRELRFLLGEESEIRLDANRAFTLSGAVDLCQEVHKYNIAYIEEPTVFTDLPLFCEQSPIPCALDESLRDRQEAEYSQLPAAAWIIKPSCMGGLSRNRQVIQKAHALGITCVVTSAFESSVGIALLAGFAATVNQKPVAHGLATLDWFASQFPRPP